MNRTIFFARILAIVILLVFALLMMNLYAKLKRLEAEQGPAPVTSTAPR